MLPNYEIDNTAYVINFYIIPSYSFAKFKKLQCVEKPSVRLESNVILTQPRLVSEKKKIEEVNSESINNFYLSF